MALILSIPQNVRAATYYSYGDHEITYNSYLYGFYITSASTSGLPQDYKISSDVFEDLIESDAKGLQYEIANRIDDISETLHGIKVGEWILQGTESFANFIFGSYVNALQATNSFIHDFIWGEYTTYSWNYYFTGADPNYPGSGDYGTAYGFRFIGAAGEKFDFVLDANGDYYGHNLIGNWTPSEDPGPTNWILINQGLDNFYTPSLSISTFDDLTLPYIEGKTLHYFVKSNNTDIHYTVPDFTNTLIGATVNSSRYDMFFYSDHNIVVTEDGFNIAAGITNRTYKNNTTFWPNAYDEIKYYATYFRWSPFSFNLPFYPSTNVIGNPIYNGVFNQNPVAGNNYIFLKGFSYTPVTNPEPIPEVPVPITSIPDDPEDPIPQSNPEPVPGIEYPVNPTPPPLKPVPSIVSGNDDLWPSVVELQNIEIDLSGYLSGLGDYSFPDLSVITESFAGSIVWVSALMSTLFNGSDYSILFAVLSSFFIVAALLGLYKWWNHK